MPVARAEIQNQSLYEQPTSVETGATIWHQTHSSNHSIVKILHCRLNNQRLMQAFDPCIFYSLEPLALDGMYKLRFDDVQHRNFLKIHSALRTASIVEIDRSRAIFLAYY